MVSRSQQTLSIEAKIKAGQSLSSIAREFGVSRTLIQKYKRRMLADYEAVTCTAPSPTPSPSASSPMKTFTINLTPAVHDALVEACAVANRKCPEESITIVEYIEELVVTQVVEMGLVRKNKRRKFGSSQVKSDSRRQW